MHCIYRVSLNSYDWRRVLKGSLNYNSMNKKLFLAFAASLYILGGNAQEKVEIKVTGRALFDAATYTQNDQAKTEDGEMNEGVGIRDMRVGFKSHLR